MPGEDISRQIEGETLSLESIDENLIQSTFQKLQSSEVTALNITLASGINLNEAQDKKNLKAIITLINSLKNNKSIKSLTIQASCLRDEGAKAIAFIINTIPNLESLNLQNCFIRDEGLKELAQALESNKSLRKLDLVNNDYSTEALKALNESMDKNEGLESIEIDEGFMLISDSDDEEENKPQEESEQKVIANKIHEKADRNKLNHLPKEAIHLHQPKFFEPQTVTHELRTYDEWHEALQKNVHLLSLLAKPENRKGLNTGEYEKICLEALKKYDMIVFNYVPPENWTYDLCLSAVTKDPSWFRELQKNKAQISLTSEEYRQLCLKIMETDSSVLRHIDPDMLTYDLFLAAINKNVDALYYINDQEIRKKLTEEEYSALCKEAKDKYGIKETFQYLPPEMRTYDVCLQAAHENIEVRRYLDRQKLTSQQYLDIFLVILKNKYIKYIDPNISDNILRNFIGRYESINKFNNYKMDDPENFLSLNKKEINVIYQLLGEHAFLLMENMLLTSDHSLKRFLAELKVITENSNILSSCSKNILRFIDKLDYQNASEKVSQLKLYLFLSEEEKKEINHLLDDDKINIENIENAEKELIIKRLHEYLGISYSKEKNVMTKLSNDQLADLNSLFEYMKQHPDQDKNKIFFSMLKMYLENIPFHYLHQPDEMSKKGDTYMVEMAQHNEKLRTELTNKGIDVGKAFSYKNQVPLKFDEHQKQKILEILSVIYKKIKESTVNQKTDAVNKNIKNLLTQIEKGKESSDTKLFKILSEANLRLLDKIVNALPEIKTEYAELKSLISKPGLKVDSLTNYKPREFHIEMWDKSKIDTLFLGDYLSCCLATTGSARDQYAPRVFDDAFLMPVIIDEATKRPVCGAWLFFGEASNASSNKQTMDVVANFFEINAGIAENKQLMNFLVVNFLHYIEQFSKSVHAHEFIMRPLSYGMIPDFPYFGTFPTTNSTSVEKVGGYFGNEKYYLDATNATKTASFYQFDQTNLAEPMQKLIVDEPKMKGYASSMTLGFASKPQTVSSTESHPTPPDPGHRFNG